MICFFDQSGQFIDRCFVKLICTRKVQALMLVAKFQKSATLPQLHASECARCLFLSGRPATKAYLRDVGVIPIQPHLLNGTRHVAKG